MLRTFNQKCQGDLMEVSERVNCLYRKMGTFF